VSHTARRSLCQKRRNRAETWNEESERKRRKQAQRRDKMHRLIKGKIARALPQSTVHSVCVYSAKCHTIYLFCNMQL
jgi:hypothetical protein